MLIVRCVWDRGLMMTLRYLFRLSSGKIECPLRSTKETDWRGDYSARRMGFESSDLGMLILSNTLDIKVEI